jgi:hypothetical protein
VKKFISDSLLTAVFTDMVFSQNLTLTVRGTIIDTDSKLPLIGASVLAQGVNVPVVAATDANDNIRINKVQEESVTKRLPDINLY